MKIKTIICFLLVLIITLTGCNTANNSEICAWQYSGTDFDAFLEWFIANRKATDLLTIPVLQTDEYCFHSVIVNEYNYMFHYIIADETADTLRDSDTELTVYISREEDSFNAVMEQHGLTPIDGVAYNERNNGWYLNDKGKRIVISFPNNTVLESSDQISEYFTFEEYGFSDGSSLVTE